MADRRRVSVDFDDTGTEPVVGHPESAAQVFRAGNPMGNRQESQPPLELRHDPQDQAARWSRHRVGVSPRRQGPAPPEGKVVPGRQSGLPDTAGQTQQPGVLGSPVSSQNPGPPVQQGNRAERRMRRYCLRAFLHGCVTRPAQWDAAPGAEVRRFGNGISRELAASSREGQGLIKGSALSRGHRWKGCAGTCFDDASTSG